MPDDRWISVVLKNKKTGETMTLYHPPANGQKVDQRLRYEILGLPAPTDSEIAITALPSPADWLTALVPAAKVPPHTP